MRIAIVDDEEVVRENLKTLLGIYAPDCEVVVEADGVQSALQALRQNTVDLLLLDVEMKDGTGFDLLAFYGELDFELIFVTGHDGYAIKAFKYSAIDYLLKPVDPEDLQLALKKAKEQTNKEERNLRLATLMDNKQVTQMEQKVILKDAETVYLVTLCEIIRCESENNYTKFFLTNGRKLFISKTLKEYDALFQGQYFFRAHQSHLINLFHFDRYEKKEGGIVYMKDGSTLPVAVRKRDALMQALQSL